METNDYLIEILDNLLTSYSLENNEDNRMQLLNHIQQLEDYIERSKNSRG